MKQAKFRLTIAFLCSAVCLLPSAFGQPLNRRKFIYDSLGKRDPFIPLTDPSSPTGIRTVFERVSAEVKLPLEIDLQGILRKGESFYVIINNQVLREGESLGPVLIEEIRQNKVILRYSERNFTFFLEPPE